MPASFEDVYTCNSMEIIALMTAMTDTRLAVQATISEIRKYRRRLSSTHRLSEDIAETLQASESFLSVVQLHFWYLTRPDSLLQIPGTNAEKSGIKTLVCST
jgi:hypothetical protein